MKLYSGKRHTNQYVVAVPWNITLQYTNPLTATPICSQHTSSCQLGLWCGVGITLVGGGHEFQQTTVQSFFSIFFLPTSLQLQAWQIWDQSFSQVPRPLFRWTVPSTRMVYWQCVNRSIPSMAVVAFLLLVNIMYHILRKARGMKMCGTRMSGENKYN